MKKISEQRVRMWELSNPEPVGDPVEHIRWLDKRSRELRAPLEMETYDASVDYDVDNNVQGRLSPRKVVLPSEKFSLNRIESEWGSISPLGYQRGTAIGLLKGFRGDGHIMRTKNPDLM